MATLSPDVTAALATLRVRWGWAAPRPLGERLASGPASDVEPAGRGSEGFGEVVGSLAIAPLPAPAEFEPSPVPGPVALPSLPSPTPTPLGWPGTDPRDGIVTTGFAELDAILGPGGLPRAASVAIRGDGSSGRTTLALRVAAEAQAAGGIVAWLDLGRSFDPVEAVARGVQLEWLVVATPADPEEGLAIAGSLLAGRSVDLLVVDLPPRAGRGIRELADRLGRLAALGRRAGTTLVLLEPPGVAERLAAAVAGAAGLRLELVRRAWIRLGRDVVGQRTEVTVARNRFGPPGRRAELRILYADGGERDRCLGRDELLLGWPDPDPPRLQPLVPATLAPATRPPGPQPLRPLALVPAPAIPQLEHHADATPPSLLAAPPPRPGASPAPRPVAERPDRHRRPAVDGRAGPRRGSGRSRAGRPAGDPAR
jgi:recombination protein RecA